MATSQPVNQVGSADQAARHERIVAQYLAGDPIGVIAADEGVCVKTVRNVARRHGLPRRRPDCAVRDARIAERYARGDRVTDIAEDAGVRTQYVRAVAVRASLPPREGWQRRYALDERAFDEPDDVGWWLVGLLAADGCVFESEHRISLAQRASDADVLLAFLNYVGSSERPLVDLTLSPEAAARAWPRSPAQEARVFSRHMCAALAKHGVVARKSRSLTFSDEAARQPAVWLGMLDGHGSVGLHRSHGGPRMDWYGTRTAMSQCSAFLSEVLDRRVGRAPNVLDHAGGLSKISITGESASRAAAVLLAASPISHRRKRGVLEEVAIYQPSRRLKSVD